MRHAWTILAYPVRIRINTAFEIKDDYGYTIDTTEFTIPVNGNDDEDDPDLYTTITIPKPNRGNARPPYPGATEDHSAAITRLNLMISRQRLRLPKTRPQTRTTIGDPVTATDPNNIETPNTDRLTYSLTGHRRRRRLLHALTPPDRANRDLCPEWPWTTRPRDTYHVAVFVRDSKDIHGNPDAVEDNSIDVTIKVTDVNEAPDPPAAPSVSPKTGTTDSLEVSWTAPDTEGKPDVTGYELQYQVEGTDPPEWSTANVQITDTTATITGLDSGTTYEVQVRASNDEGDSDWSPSGTGTTDNTAPAFDDVIPQGENSLSSLCAGEQRCRSAPNVGTARVAATDARTATNLTYSLGRHRRGILRHRVHQWPDTRPKQA